MVARPPANASWSTRRAAPDLTNNRVPAFAWLMFGLSLALTLAAAILFLRKTEGRSSHALPEGTADPPQAAAQPKREELAPITTRAPLDITQQMLEAKRRAKIWHPEAVLTELEAIVSESSELQSLSIEYGQALRKSGHRAPVNTRRLLVSTVGQKTTSRELTKTSLQRALAEPSCPLQVAVRKWRESGADPRGHLGIMLIESEQHGRLVWMITSANGGTYSIDAKTCALLRR